MPDHVFQPPPVVTLPIVGTDKTFPVHRVYCIGRNYAAHAVEMGHDPDREAPFFFQKNADNLDCSGEFPYPDHSDSVHHEAELAVMLKSGGAAIPVQAAQAHIYGYAPALDMTRRDLQQQQKSLGRPWEVGKAFERSAPIGQIHPVTEVGHLDQGMIELLVNEETRQRGDLAQMIWKVPEIIAGLSDYFTLAAGDVILTGTPAGVGPVRRGDTLRLTIERLGHMTTRVV